MLNLDALDAVSRLGAMDPDDKLVLDHIAQTTNQGIWIRTLKAKTGLHQTVINKSIKALEQKKMIKNVKSVKVGHVQDMRRRGWQGVAIHAKQFGCSDHCSSQPGRSICWRTWCHR